MSDFIEGVADTSVGVASGYALAKALEVNTNESDAKTAGIVVGAALLSSIVDSVLISPMFDNPDENSSASRFVNLAVRGVAAAHGLKRNEDVPNSWLYGVAWFIAGAPGLGVAIEQGFREKV